VWSRLQIPAFAGMTVEIPAFAGMAGGAAFVVRLA
jgi:hypothetical protein